MAEIVKRGEFSNRPYKFIISGDEPNVDEQMRIDQVLREREFSFAKDYESKYGQQLTDEGSGVLNYLNEIPKGIARGGVGIFESALLGGAALLPEGAETRAREGIRGLAYALKPQADVGLEDSVAAKGSEALGSFGALGLTSLIPYAGPVAAGALAIGAGAGEASERARAAGATEEERTRAALLGAPAGALSLGPLKFISVLGKAATGTIVNRLARAAATGGVEAAEEAATTIAQNLIEQGVYNPEKGTFADTGEALGYGAGVGALVQGLLDLLPGRSVGSADTTTIDPAATPAAGTTTPPVTPPGTPPSTASATPTGTPSEAPIITPAPSATSSGAATVSGVRRVIGRVTTTTVGLDDGTDLTLYGNVTQADIDRAVSEYNNTKAAAAPSTPSGAASGAPKPKTNVGDIPEAEIIPDEAPIVTPAPTVTLDDVPPAPKYKINKVSTKKTTIKTDKTKAYRTVADVEGIGPVEIYSSKGFFGKNDDALQPAIYNQLNPTQVGEVGLNDIGVPPLTAYPEGVSSEPVNVSTVGMGDVGFAPTESYGQEEAPVGGLFGGTTTSATPATPATPSDMDTEADALERAEAQAAEERKFAEAAAEADRRVAAADAAKAQAKPAAKSAQGDLFGAPQAAPQAVLTTTQEATNVREGAEAQLAEAGASVPGGAPRVGEGTGAGSEGQTPEVITASGAGRLAGSVQSSDDVGAAGGAESGALTESEAQLVAARKKNLTPNKALKARLAALSDYFTPGNIVETALGGTDRVRSFDVDADGNWTVTVDAVKKENGQWVLKNRPEDYRTHRTSPPKDNKGNYKKPIERAKPVEEVAADATNQAEVAALRKQHLREYFHPGGEWLTGKQVVASKNPDRKFMVGPITADIGTKTDVFLPTDVLSGLPGMENEVRRAGDPRYDALLADAQENGFDPDQKKNKIVVAVNHYGQAYILEGNTRVAVAKALGVANVKAEVRYWNGGEDVDGPMSPNNVLATLASENNAGQRQAEATNQTATAVKLPMATVASASALDKPLSYNTREYLEEGDLKGALLSLSSETKNPILKALAKKFSQLVGTTRVKVVYPGDPNAVYLEGNVSVFWQDFADGNPEQQNIIYIDAMDGLTAHALMHEMAHAVTVNIMFRFPNLPAMRQLQSLFESVRAQADEPGSLGYTAELYGLNNLREFVAEAYGRIAFGSRDSGLRDLMSNTLFTNVKYETNELPLTNYERFKEIMGNFFRGLVGMPSKQYPRRKITDKVTATETGLDRFHQIMDGLLSPAPQILPGKIYNAAVSEPLIGRNVLNNAGKVPAWSPSAATRMYNVIRENIPDWLRSFALSLQQIDWIADFSRKALPVIDDLKSILDRRQGELARLQKKVSQLPKRLAVLAEEAPEQFSRYTNILDTATRNEVDIAKPRNTYKDDAGKLFIWDKLTADMKAIDPNGKFREVYKLHYELNESNRKEFLDGVTIAVDAVTGDPVERVSLRNKIMAQLIEGGVIDPYLPLMRKGDYWVSYVQTESTGKPPVAPGTGAKAPLFEAEKVVTPFKTPAAARAFIAQLNASKLPDGRPAAVEITQEPFLVDYSQGYDKTIPLEFVQSAVDIMNEVVPEASQREAGRIAIMELFTRMSPAYSAMARLRSRKDGGRAGAMGYESPVGIITEPHAYISALEDHLAGTVNTIVNVKFGPQLDAAKSRLQAQAENAQKDPANTLADKIAINATANELNKRINFARNPTASRPAYHTRGLTFLWTLGALPAATINVFFQMPMVVIPQLMGRHKVGDIARALNVARLITQSSGTSQVIQEPGRTDQTQVTDIENWGSLENYYSIDAAGNFTLRTDRKIPASIRAQLEELAPLAQYMSLNGMLGTTIAQSEITGMGDVASRIYRFSGLPLQYAERFTRQSTAVAAFVLEMNKLKADQGSKNYKPTPEQINAAVKYAVDTTELTNGTVGVLTGPSAAFGGLGSVVLMYKRYALSMLRFITNGVQRSLTKITPGMTPDQVADAKMERKIARYQMGMMLGSTAIFAGVQGMPFFGEVTTILDMIFTDDDEEDFATVVQKSLQQPLYSGLVNYLTGAEVASRISMSGLVFRESPIKKDQSLIYDLVDMFGGPVLGTANNMLRGIDLVNDGEVYRGIEAGVPALVRSFMRAGRYIEAGGAETMRGDQITPLDSWDVAVQLLGYTPEVVIRTQEAVGREKRITEAIRSKKNQLYKRFNLALVDGDYEEVRQVQQEMVEFMREHPELGGFDLKASVRGFRQRSQDMIGGVYIPKPFQPRTRESLEEYGQEGLQ
jgi:hypothetical protein